ncbi:MAG TPA: carboxypeptidase-like regulatory domain-containing protein [Solirubrobacteraceae bacterium]|nr:carboxypeptidase-like regulatory domain-containing protein [Solirubrobacteraceae bacterium]
MHALDVIRTRRPATRSALPAAALLLAAVVLALAPPRALAGRYVVYSCRTPAGESAPADGWSGSVTGSEAVAEDTCSQPSGALVAGLHAHTPRTANSATATWAFAAPAGESIAEATLWRAGDAEGGAVPEDNASYQYFLAGPTETSLFEECVSALGCTSKGSAQPLSPENDVVVPADHLGTHLFLSASCRGVSGYNCPEGAGDSNGYAAVVYLYAAQITLEQEAGPTGSVVSGELASAPTVSGTSDVAFDASDAGSGVYEAVFSVDGQVVQRTVIDEDGGRCRSVGAAANGAAAFEYVQPCPASVSADVGFDTTAVSNGEHHLVVSVTDAAGNATTVLDRDVTVENAPAPGAPNGTNASPHASLAVSWKGTRSERLRSAYGRAHTIVGRLTADGAAIAGARVVVLATPAYAGARVAAPSGVQTDARGDFSLRVPADASSRALRFEYSDATGSPPVAVRTLTLSVRAGVTLHVAPRTASAGASIRFRGRLLGGPIPPGGKLLVLEARSPGGAWLEFDVLRSDAHGAFSASYRFKFPGPAVYQFRVLCQAEADYPFARGASNVVAVFERG